MNAALDRLSLVIVTWNGDELLKNCLDSIVKTYGHLPETVVVDNANLASTAALVSTYENIRYIPLPLNRGFAGGNNAALPFCTKEYLVLLNNDTQLVSDSFSSLVEFLDAHPEAAAAQGKILLGNGKTLDGCGGFFSPLGILAFRGAFIPDSPEFDRPERVFALSGAFFAIRRSVLPSCDGLFRDHFKSYYEEIDLCHRLALAGYDCWYVPTPAILHKHSATSNKFARGEILTQYYRNIWFSFLTCFNAWNRLRFGTTLALLCASHALAGLGRGNATPFKAHAKALRMLCADRPLVRQTRRTLAALRKRTDREILACAVRSQPWSYYKSLFVHNR